MASALEIYTLAILAKPPWTSISLANAWVNYGSPFVNAQYRLWPLTNEYEVIGRNKNGTITDGTTLFTLPTAPASSQDKPIAVVTTTGGAGGKTPLILVNASTGTAQCFYLPTGTTAIGFHFWVSPDA